MVAHPYSTCERTLLPESPPQARSGSGHVQTLTDVLERILPLPFRRTTNDVPIITTKLFPKNHRPCGKFEYAVGAMQAPETVSRSSATITPVGGKNLPQFQYPRVPKFRRWPNADLDKQSRLVIENLSRLEVWGVGVLCLNLSAKGTFLSGTAGSSGDGAIEKVD